MDGICSRHPNIIVRITATKHTKSERLSNTVQFQHKRITNPTITHTNKVMHPLADCVKALQGMTSSARNSQAAQDLQQIMEATKAHVQAQPDRFTDVATPSAIPNIQQVPRVQTPNLPQVLRVQALPSVPAKDHTLHAHTAISSKGAQQRNANHHANLLSQTRMH
jgi:hypothetical protein